jgi:hypothetical protein
VIFVALHVLGGEVVVATMVTAAIFLSRPMRQSNRRVLKFPSP